MPISIKMQNGGHCPIKKAPWHSKLGNRKKNYSDSKKNQLGSTGPTGRQRASLQKRVRHEEREGRTARGPGPGLQLDAGCSTKDCWKGEGEGLRGAQGQACSRMPAASLGGLRGKD
eukprot:3567925-Karenia_brevis.AAC.2